MMHMPKVELIWMSFIYNNASYSERAGDGLVVWRCIFDLIREKKKTSYPTPFCCPQTLKNHQTVGRFGCKICSHWNCEGKCGGAEGTINPLRCHRATKMGTFIFEASPKVVVLQEIFKYEVSKYNKEKHAINGQNFHKTSCFYQCMAQIMLTFRFLWLKYASTQSCQSSVNSPEVNYFTCCHRVALRSRNQALCSPWMTSQTVSCLLQKKRQHKTCGRLKEND